MRDQTGAVSAATRVLADPVTAKLPSIDELRLEGYLQDYADVVPLSEYRPESELPSLTSTPAPWLGAVQRRLNASIGLEGIEGRNDGAWLIKEVVSNANSVFDAASNLFPSEPYLYGSRAGDLVAEFEGKEGRMTMVVTKEALITFAVAGKKTIRRQMKLIPFTPADIRRGVADIANSLGSGSYGSVDAEKE
jgi:hypothetical protein